MSTKMNKQNKVRVTFHGYIENTRDALLLFEACKRGIIPRISRRLQDKERHLIKSGSIFCFDENESGIKRWTDGLMWSPSRILGNFLIYRELDDKKLIRSSSADYGTTNIDENNNEMLRSRSSSFGSSTAITASGYVIAPDHLRRQREKALLGSLKNSYKFKRNGLIKKSMSLIVDGIQQHIISYYSKDDVLSNKLKTPCSIVELSSLEVSPGLCLRQNFRIPILLTEEISDDRFNKEDYQNNSKRKFSDFSSIPQYEIESSTSDDSNLLISSIDNQQPLLSFSSQAPVTNLSNRLYTPVTQDNSSYSTSGSRMNQNSSAKLFPFDSYDDTNIHTVSHKKNSSNNMYPSKDIHYQDRLRLSTPQYNNHATQLSEVEQQSSMMTNQTKKPFIPMNNEPKSSLPDIIQIDNISFDKKLSNTNNITSAKAFSNINNKREVPNTHPYNSGISTNFLPTNQMDISPTRGGFYKSVYVDDYHQGQNPHQHLFSSSSFHAVNHAALSNRTELATNSFMLDMNLLLGTGWNEFELQM